MQLAAAHASLLPHRKADEAGAEARRRVQRSGNLLGTAGAARLGALMIDNRLAEDIQLKLRPEHFFEPLHGRIYEQLLRLLDRNMIASPVTRSCRKALSRASRTRMSR